MKYEYGLVYYRKSTGKCIGHSADAFTTQKDAELRSLEINSRYGKLGDEVRVCRREVGEWEEIK